MYYIKDIIITEHSLKHIKVIVIKVIVSLVKYTIIETIVSFFIKQNYIQCITFFNTVVREIVCVSGDNKLATSRTTGL